MKTRGAKVGGHVAKEKRKDEGNAREENRCRRARERGEIRNIGEASRAERHAGEERN